MHETVKTTTFVLIAAAALAVAWIARPATPARTSFEDSGQPFYPEFADPLKARSLSITAYDPQTASARTFKVAQKNGVWSLPSNEDYPADAEEQLAAAASSLMQIVKGPTQSDSTGDHELYGVIDPVDAKAGAAGVGTHVRLADEADRTLAEFIVGLSVKDSPGQRYVRVPGKDRVYLARINIDKLSTKFGDWIEKDLLKLNTGDITRVVVNGYSIDEVNSRIMPGDMLEFSHDSKAQTWSLNGLKANEEVVSEKVEEMRRALADLKIVDVHRKPAGLSRELRAKDEMRLDETALASLASRGYYVVQGQLLSNEGDMAVQLKTGVEYLLRFGEIATRDREVRTEAESESASTAAAGVNRYLFVAAQINESLIPEPQLEQLPDESIPPPKMGDPEGDKQIEQLIKDARVRIEEGNKKKSEDYEKAIKDARETVKALNDRFAEWYYVIADDVYKKIHLTRADVVRAAAAAAPASAEAPTPPAPAAATPPLPTAGEPAEPSPPPAPAEPAPAEPQPQPAPTQPQP